MKKFLLFFLISFVLLSCERSDVSPSVDPVKMERGALYEYLIAPSATNPSILLFNNNHYVTIDTRTTLRNKLFVFLPGTGGSPEFYKLIVKKAASLGYHAIGLMYPNSSDMYSWSASNPDNSQFGKCRQEIFDGTNQTFGVTVDANNCIRGRLVKLVQYMAARYPGLNYQQFLNGNDVVWSNCVVAGHSQGGGHAFYIAKQVAVTKAVAFASIDWNTLLGRSADWVTAAGVTPVSKFYSINSTRDEVFSYTNVQTQLADMGLTGTATSIDNNSSPYGGTHKLITTANPAISLVVPNHNLTCLDGYVPKTSTGSVTTAFANAWTYL
ncbi:MAG: BPSS1187 family protein, partial [Bacteroidota bacterium]